MPRKPRATSRRALSVGAAIPVAQPPRRPEKPTGINPVTTIEYRLVWQREGLEPKEKKFSNKKRAYDRAMVMTSNEPWKYFGSPSDRLRLGDEYFCCADPNAICKCGGRTLREDAIYRRAHMPPLVWLRVDRRVVTRSKWEPYEMVMDGVPETTNTYITESEAQVYFMETPLGPTPEATYSFTVGLTFSDIEDDEF
jgi:hypothetical protein